MSSIRLLCALAAAAARGDAEGTRDGAVAVGDGARVRAVLRMLHPFVGFPRALDAWMAAAKSLTGAGDAAPEPADAAAVGRATFRRVYGDEADAILAKIASLDAEAARRVLADAYGRVLSQDDLALAARERIAVVVLAAQGLRNQLPGHVRGALRCGVASADIREDVVACMRWIRAEDAAAVEAALARFGRDAGSGPAR